MAKRKPTATTIQPGEDEQVWVLAVGGHWLSEAAHLHKQSDNQAACASGWVNGTSWEASDTNRIKPPAPSARETGLRCRSTPRTHSARAQPCGTLHAGGTASCLGEERKIREGREPIGF